MISDTSPVYRPDIDGLRAIAVLAVIAFHASTRLVPGGFAGVDIFFVISGYLISGILWKRIDSGTFRFSDFYQRRIKRILPAYIVVALFTLLLSSYLLIPNDYIFYTTSLAASWAFASNIFFSMLSWGYFGQRTEEFPLLHTWSLSVEEQFYFIFPVLLIFLARYFKRWMIVLLLVLGIAFVALSQMNAAQVKSYFLLTSRAHELIAGAVTFFIARKYPLRSWRVSSAAAVAGMALIIASIFLLRRGVAFPGINSLYPSVGTALVLYACTTDNLVMPLLKNRLLVFVGLISYSLYLWHWPIFVFLRYRHVDITAWVGAAAVGISFLLAFLTWKLVETPIRHNTTIGFRQAFLTLYLMPALFFLAVGLYSYRTEGAPQRFPEDIRQLIASYSFERDLTRACSIRAEDYQKITVDYLHEHCAFGDMAQTAAQVLLMGDSHAYHFKPFVEYLARQANLKAVYHVQGSCLPISLFDPASASGSEPSTCQKHNADLLQIAAHFKYVVLGGSWRYRGESEEREFEHDLSRVVKLILRSGATPVIFKDNPYFEPDLSQCILLKRRGWMASDRNCNIPYTFVADSLGSADQAIDRIQKIYPKTIVIDPKRVMCNTKECSTYIANVALYKDSNHINAKAARLLAEKYLAANGNVFSDDGISLRVSERGGTGAKR